MFAHLNSFSFAAIIGKPGSGKTSLLISCLTGKGNNKTFRKVSDHTQASDAQVFTRINERESILRKVVQCAVRPILIETKTENTIRNKNACTPIFGCILEVLRQRSRYFEFFSATFEFFTIILVQISNILSTAYLDNRFSIQ